MVRSTQVKKGCEQLVLNNISWVWLFCADTNAYICSKFAAQIVYKSQVIPLLSLLSFLGSSAILLWQLQNCVTYEHWQAWLTLCYLTRPFMLTIIYWTITITSFVESIYCFEWQWPPSLKICMKPPLCKHHTFCFIKKQHSLYAPLNSKSSFVSHFATIHKKLTWNERVY